LAPRCAVGKNSIAEVRKKMQDLKQKAKGSPTAQSGPEEVGTEMQEVKTEEEKKMLSPDPETEDKKMLRGKETDIV
jgi:hypothetical protein